MSKEEILDLDDCRDKLEKLLKEYNCEIILDKEVELVILVDKDTKEFRYV